MFNRTRYKEKLVRFDWLFLLKAITNMFVTYALYSQNFNKIYIGYTADLIDRIYFFKPNLLIFY
jgi:hypothetical protein